MLVSVIITTYSRTDYLVRAIESVLNQTYENLETIVVDDNGKGKHQEITKQILSKYEKVKLIAYDENKGACYARNIGAKNASGEIIMFLDDDDYYLKTKVAKQYQNFINTDIDACICAMRRIDENSDEIVSYENFPRGNDLKSFIISGNCYTPMIAIKKSVFESLGGFSETPRFQDKFFMYKFYKNKFKAQLINEQLCVMVEHSGERISFGSVPKISKALNFLHQFEKEIFPLLNYKEKTMVKRRYYKNMAEIRTNSNIKIRLIGLLYLIKSNVLSIKNNFTKQKIFIRLILSDKIYNKFK